MTCPNLSLHPSHKYPYCVPGTADKLVNKTDREPCPPGADAVSEVNTQWLKKVYSFSSRFFFFFLPPTPILPISPRAGNQVYPISLTGITKPFSLHEIDTVQVQPNSPWNSTLFTFCLFVCFQPQRPKTFNQSERFSSPSAALGRSITRQWREPAQDPCSPR